MQKILIQSILDTSNYKTKYYMKQGDNKSKKISKKKWFELYDKIGIDNIKILAPLSRD